MGALVRLGSIRNKNNLNNASKPLFESYSHSGILDFHSGCSAPRSRIAGIYSGIYSGISRTNAPFVENNRTIILPGDTRRPTTSELPDVGAKLEAWRMKMLYNFHFLKSDMGVAIINSFS